MLVRPPACRATCWRATPSLPMHSPAGRNAREPKVMSAQRTLPERGPRQRSNRHRGGRPRSILVHNGESCQAHRHQAGGSAVCRAAPPRMSSHTLPGCPTPKNQENFDTAPKLLEYCLKHGHFSVFETVSMSVEVTTSRAIADQIIRHRSFCIQQLSARYAETPGVCDVHATQARHTEQTELHRRHGRRDTVVVRRCPEACSGCLHQAVPRSSQQGYRQGVWRGSCCP